MGWTLSPLVDVNDRVGTGVGQRGERATLARRNLRGSSTSYGAAASFRAWVAKKRLSRQQSFQSVLEELVRSVHDTGEAVVVLQGGEPAAVLVGATEFAALREHRRFLAAIGEGVADVNAGRVLTTQELKQSFEAEFGPIGWQ